MIKFNQPALLTLALTHRSAINEKKGLKVSNERLEFLGDAILELIVSEYLYQKYPVYPEGKLTNLRAQIVQTKTLAAAAEKLNLGESLIMSRGEKKAGGNTNPSLLANTFEAVTGAVYLDKGFIRAKDFIFVNLIRQLPQLLKTAEVTDYKSLLQEQWQKQFRIAPVYKLLAATGPDHAKIFTVRVYCRRRLAGEGSGKSKQTAEQAAARQAIEKRNFSC